MSQNASVEKLCCALFYMLSRQANHSDQHLQIAIRDHFQWLASHVDGEHYPELIKISHRLANHWDRMYLLNSGQPPTLKIH